MFFHRNYIFLFGENPCTNSDEMNDLVVKPETPFKNATFPFSPRPTSEQERKLVHDTPSIYYNKPVVCLPLKFPISVLRHARACVRACARACVCVLVLKWETLEVNTRLAFYNKLRECRELIFSLTLT